MYIDIFYGKEYRKWCENNDKRHEEFTRKWYKNEIINEQKDKIDSDEIKRIEKIAKHRDLKFNLTGRIRSAISLSLKSNKPRGSWELIVGYNVNDLTKHLIKTMPKGYNWEDYINTKLVVDHIIPISAFNFSKPEHINFKRCWALSNLRLLPARENILKSNKLIKPFQLSFAI